jgi:hypothetical protein
MAISRTRELSRFECREVVRNYRTGVLVFHENTIEFGTEGRSTDISGRSGDHKFRASTNCRQQVLVTT